jgi:hypothetical protein
MQMTTQADILRLISGSRERQNADLILDYVDQQIATLNNVAGLLTGKFSYGTLHIASAVKDGETVTIGQNVYEFDTTVEPGLNGGSRKRVNLSAGSGVAQEGTLTMDTQPTAGDTLTIGTKVYTFVPAGTATADGEISVGANLAAAKVNLVAAVNGTDSISDPHPLVTMAAFIADAAKITAIIPGIYDVATTETFTAGTNVFDAAKLGTTTAGVDPTAAEATTALAAAINANAAEVVEAIRVSANIVLVVAKTVGPVEAATTETMTGANNAWDAANLNAGHAPVARRSVSGYWVPVAGEVTAGLICIPVAFNPRTILIHIHVTATGAVKAWDGNAKYIDAADGKPAYVTLDNAGNVDWAATDTIYYTFSE